MDGGVQVVDQLGADTVLRQNQADRRPRRVCIASQHIDHVSVRLGRFQTLRVDHGRHGVGEAGQGLLGALEESSDLTTRPAGALASEALGGIGEEELIALLDGLDPLPDLLEAQGVILEVTPRVNASGLVVLEIMQEVSDVVATTTSTLNSPTIQQRRIESTVAVQSGETIALGGLIRDSESEVRAGIPIISEVPIIGNLFKTTTTTTRRTELLVLITPRVVRDQSEAREVTEELRRRVGALKPLEAKIQAPAEPAPEEQ